MTSKEVFDKRRSGAIDEAYGMALRLMENPNHGEWDIKAMSWCLIDLIKRDSKAGQQRNIEVYRQQLEVLETDPKDKVLSGQRDYAMKLCSPNGQLIQRAKLLSNEGKYLEAVNLLWELFNNGDHSDEVQTGLAWGLYRLAKAMLDQDPPNYGKAKSCLNDYFKLNIEKPSVLHSCFLVIADKLVKPDKIKMGPFVRIWGLEYLRPDDYEPFVTNDGETLLSLAERVIQHACKDASKRNAIEDLNYINPYIDECIERCPDNLWLKLSKAKVLNALGLNDMAITFGLEVAKNKAGDYWAWELLGDIHRELSADLMMSCYCKALLCSKDINFVYKVKLKLAGLLVERGDVEKAKLELDEVVEFRTNSDLSIPDDANHLISQDWFENTKPSSSNHQFYLDQALDAEELLYSGLPWKNAVMGEQFTLEHKPGKFRRKIYVESTGFPFEVVVPESKVLMIEAKPGRCLKLKGEYDDNQRFQVYAVEKRSECADWDIFDERIGVVDHVNTQKELIHFIIDRKLDGVVPFSELNDIFRLGDVIAVRFSEYASKQGTRHRVVTVYKTDKLAPESLLKSFESDVQEENGMGFTDEGIFISPSLMTEHGVQDGDKVSGTAILSYNKKRFKWGWKAIRVEYIPIAGLIQHG